MVPFIVCAMISPSHSRLMVPPTHLLQVQQAGCAQKLVALVAVVVALVVVVVTLVVVVVVALPTWAVLNSSRSPNVSRAVLSTSKKMLVHFGAVVVCSGLHRSLVE